MRAVDTNMKTRETLRRGRLQSGIRSGCDTASPLERTGSDLYLSTAAAYKSGCATICCTRARAARNDSTELTELKTQSRMRPTERPEDWAPIWHAETSPSR